MTDADRARHLPILIENPRDFAEAALERPLPLRVLVKGQRTAEELQAADRVRSGRPRPVRARTVSTKRMTKRELELGRMLHPDVEGVARPRTRGECAGGERPCPFVSCSHHLYLDVSRKTGAIKLNFPDLEPEQMDHSCALDVAELGGETLERVGALMNVTRERVRQVENTAIAKVQAIKGRDGLRAHIEGEKRTLHGRRGDDLEEEFEEDFDVDEFVGLEDHGSVAPPANQPGAA